MIILSCAGNTLAHASSVQLQFQLVAAQLLLEQDFCQCQMKGPTRAHARIFDPLTKFVKISRIRLNVDFLAFEGCFVPLARALRVCSEAVGCHCGRLISLDSARLVLLFCAA